MEEPPLTTTFKRRSQTIGPQNGACNFCNQINVPVTPLNCKKHYYCLVCEEFCPRLRRGNFSCSKCRRKRTEDQEQQKVHDFIAKQTGTLPKKENHQFQEVTISLDGSSLITFQEPIDDPDDSDLTGNNDEWEHLLATMTSTKQQEQQPVNEPKKKATKSMKEDTYGNSGKKGHEKKSAIENILEFVIPSADQKADEDSGDNKPTEEADEGVTSEMWRISPLQEGKRCLSWSNNKLDELGSQPASAEYSEYQLERGTSPVKAIPRMNAFKWLGLLDPNDDSGYLSDGAEIEGPQRTNSPDSEATGFGSENRDHDDFWDM